MFYPLSHKLPFFFFEMERETRILQVCHSDGQQSISIFSGGIASPNMNSIVILFIWFKMCEIVWNVHEMLDEWGCDGSLQVLSNFVSAANLMICIYNHFAFQLIWFRFSYWTKIVIKFTFSYW